jgi:hypothetical protein
VLVAKAMQYLGGLPEGMGKKKVSGAALYTVRAAAGV